MDKPQHRSGYRREETELVVSACLTVAVRLGGLMDRFCIVGGLVPSLIINYEGEAEENSDSHCGTNDLDVALSIAVLDDEQYTEISQSLRQEGFHPDRNKKGNKTLQRWRLDDLKVTIDFLIPPPPGDDGGRRVQPLEGDFGALISPGLEVAFDERQMIDLDGQTLKGEKARRQIPVCGPGAFVILKALAFSERAESKDAYDLVYVLRHWPAGIEDIADRIRKHVRRHPASVARALDRLASDFEDPDRLGPMRAAAFSSTQEGDFDDEAADAHGFVDDLLRACRQGSSHFKSDPIRSAR